MPKIAPVFNGAHSNFVVRVFGANCTSMGGVSYKTESSPIIPVNKVSLLVGMFKPCAICRNYCNFCTCIKQKINLFIFYATFHKNSLVIVLDYRGKVDTHSPQ